MALSITLGQIGKIFGFSITKDGIVPRLIEFASKLGLTHLPTLGIGLSAFVVLAVSPRLVPRMPAALAAMIVTGAAVVLLGLDDGGGQGHRRSARRPSLVSVFLPSPGAFIRALCAEAAGVALIRVFKHDAHGAQLRRQEPVRN